jgi:hypothetical protein
MKLAGVLPDLLRLEELNSTDGKMRLGTWGRPVDQAKSHALNP